MSTNLKILYTCSEIPNKLFFCIISRDSTCKNVLQTISELQNANYVALFYSESQIDDDEEIIDYWQSDEIFYASTTVTPPTSEFMNNVKALKEDTISTADMSNPSSVRQIIMVNLNESQSMMCDMDGQIIDKNSDKDDRITIAIQYLTIFISRIYGYHIQSIQGLISFNNEIKVKCPLSPFVSDFEDKGLKNIKPKSTRKLWDSLFKSCEEISKFRKNNSGKDIYENAQSRILVISDGDDENSSVKVEDVVKELINNRIIVDSVIIGSKDECKMLCAVCHATGGFSMRPESVSKGISLFEKSAFLNIVERKDRSDPLIPGNRNTLTHKLALKVDVINADLLNEAKKIASFDTEIINKELFQASQNDQLTTPRQFCPKNINKSIHSSRQKRILRELFVAAEANDPKSPFYDPDLKIYPLQANVDRWKAYIKGPSGTLYENKWWYLYIILPELYPAQPPIFKFKSVPYHINVSSDGNICLNIDYNSSKHIIDIIQEIKEIFLLPDLDTPIQIDTYEMFLNNKDQYEKLARESTQMNAKDNVEDFIGDDVPENFEFKSFEIPYYMISDRRKVKKMVKVSADAYYDRDELRQLVASSDKPI